MQVVYVFIFDLILLVTVQLVQSSWTKKIVYHYDEKIVNTQRNLTSTVKLSAAYE